MDIEHLAPQLDSLPHDIWSNICSYLYGFQITILMKTFNRKISSALRETVVDFIEDSGVGVRVRWPAYVKTFKLRRFVCLSNHASASESLHSKYEHLLLLPNTLVTLVVAGPESEHMLYLRDYANSRLKTCYPLLNYSSFQDDVCYWLRNRLAQSRYYAITDSEKQELDLQIRNKYVNLNEMFPHLKHLVLRDTSSNMPVMLAEMFLYLPQQLETLSVYWNKCILPYGIPLLPRNMNFLLIGGDFNWFDVPADWPPNFSEFRQRYLKFDKVEQIENLPRNLTKLDCQTIHLKPGMRKAFPPNLTKIRATIDATDLYHELPASLSCLFLNNRNSVSRFPESLTILTISAEMEPSHFSILPPNLIVFRTKSAWIKKSTDLGIKITSIPRSLQYVCASSIPDAVLFLLKSRDIKVMIDKTPLELSLRSQRPSSKRSCKTWIDIYS